MNIVLDMDDLKKATESISYLVAVALGVANNVEELEEEMICPFPVGQYVGGETEEYTQEILGHTSRALNFIFALRRDIERGKDKAKRT